MLVADVLLGLVGLPRPSSTDDLDRDLSNGVVRSAAVVDPSGLRSSRALRGHGPEDAALPVVLWRTGALGYRTATVAHEQIGEYQRVLRRDHLPDARHDLPQRWPDTGTVVHLLVVLVLVYGPQPRRATKWAWFWLTFLPFDAGLLGLLLRDAPWSRRAGALPEPPWRRRDRQLQPHARRLTGGRALLLALLGYWLGQVVVDSLSHHVW